MHLQGIIGYLLTPCDDAGRVDHALLARHVEEMIGAGVHALAPLGSTGCRRTWTTPSARPWSRPWSAAAGRLPVLAGVSSLGTASTVRHARHAERRRGGGAGAAQHLLETDRGRDP